MTSVVRVQVIGFSDVERHALNTVFRLSREREVSYGPWRAASGLLEEMPPVLLVDGDCAEAVLVHARAPRLPDDPAGQDRGRRGGRRWRTRLGRRSAVSPRAFEMTAPLAAGRIGLRNRRGFVTMDGAVVA